MANDLSLSPEQQQLVVENLPLVHYVAGRYRHIPKPAYEDLLSRLRYRLCVCIAQWEEGRGLKISSYIVKSLEGDLKNYFRDEMWLIRPPRRLRERPLYQILTSDHYSLSEAELQDENVEKLRTCANPVSLDSRAPSDPALAKNGTGSHNLYEPSVEGPEEEVVSRIGGTQLVRQVYAALTLDERWILALHTKGRPVREIADRFRLDRESTNLVLKEVQEKAAKLYMLALDGKELPISTGNKALRSALAARFRPPQYGFSQMRAQFLDKLDNA